MLPELFKGVIMFSFLISLALLIAGYFIYGKVVEKIFGVEPDRQTPRHNPAGRG